MPSELDIQLRAIMDRLTAPDAPLETGHVVRDGGRMTVFRNAPPSLPALFGHYCEQFRDREFLIDGDVRLCFGEVHALARRAAIGLITRHGVCRGDRVGIAAANSANWVIVYMAVLMAGGCATLLNAWWKGDELANAIAQAECSLVLADAERAARMEGHGIEARMVVFDNGEPASGLASLVAGDDSTAALPGLDGDDLATILFTSGSTGLSKAAYSDHRAVIHATMSTAAQAMMLGIQMAENGITAPDREVALLCVPLFHATGEITVLLRSYFSGRTIVIMQRWNALQAMHLIERERVAFFTGVPLMSHEIANHPDRHLYDLSSCAFFAAGGAPQPADHVVQLNDSMRHASQVQGYGLTETNAVGCTNYTENYLAKPNSTGPANYPLVEVIVVGPSGEALPAGMVGEIAIRSICNFRGYWNDPAATQACVRPDGFFLTGDLGKMDEAGYLFVIDRKKDIIIRGGENIAAVEVERAIYSHPSVAEVSVFGLPDDRYGEVPVAVYHTKIGRELDARELQSHLAERIATFKIPVQFWEQDQALPRLGAEKVDKRALKERYARIWTGAKR